MTALQGELSAKHEQMREQSENMAALQGQLLTTKQTLAKGYTLLKMALMAVSVQCCFLLFKQVRAGN